MKRFGFCSLALASLVVIGTACTIGGVLLRERRERELRLRIEAWEGALSARAGEAIYIVIDTTVDSLEVRRGDCVLGRFGCATGSGQVLSGRDRTWTFVTPKGARVVRARVVNPVWIRPAWSFVERGEPVPTDRLSPVWYDSAALGDYALDLGDGYLIHGSVYPVVPRQTTTHGCVRLEREALDFVFRTVPVGAPVYVF